MTISDLFLMTFKLLLCLHFTIELEATPKLDATRSGVVRTVVFLSIILVGLFFTFLQNCLCSVVLYYLLFYYTF